MQCIEQPDDVAQDDRLLGDRQCEQPDQERFDPDRGTAQAWLPALTANHAKKVLRATRRHAPLDEVPAAPRAVGTRIDVERAIRALPRRQRLAVERCYFVGLPLADAAAVMGCAEATVESNLAAARTNLRSTLGEAVARGAAGKPVRVTVVMRREGHRAGRIQRLDLIVGTPNAIAGAGDGPGAPGGYVGRRRNHVAIAHFEPGIPADGEQFTATFVVSKPGRYPIDGQMALTFRDPFGHIVHASTGQQFGYLVITDR